MRLKLNLLSQKEYQDKKNYLANHYDQLAENEEQVIEKLGIKDYFYNQNRSRGLSNNLSH